MLAGTVRREPALSYVTVLSAVAALVIAFAHLTSTQSGYVTAIAGAVGTILVALSATPRNVAVIGGAVGTILTSLSAFGLHLGSSQVAAIVTAVGLVLGLVLRSHLTPSAE